MQSTTTRRQVMLDGGHAHIEPIEVDQVEVRLVADRDATAIVQAGKRCRLTGERGNRLGQRDALRCLGIACPAGQVIGRETRIADHPVVRAAVGQAHDRVGMLEHFAHRQQVAVAIVGAGLIEDRLAFVGDQQVIGKCFHRFSGGGCQPVDAIGDLRLVIRFGLPGIAVLKAAHGLDVDRVGVFGLLAEQLLAEHRVFHPLQALRKRQAADRLVARVIGKRVKAQFKPVEHADRARCDLGAHLQPVLGGLRQGGERFAPGIRVARRHLDQRIGQRLAAALGNASHHAEFMVGIAHRCRDDLEDAGAGIFQPFGKRAEFVFFRKEAGGEFAGLGPVQHVARGGHTQGAGFDGLGGEAAHGRQVLGGGRLLRGRALAHHIDPQCRVGQLRGDVDVELTCIQRIEIFGEGLPVPGQAFDHDHLGHVFDAFHELDQDFALIGLARRKTDAAISHHHRGHAVPGRRRKPMLPGGLSIEVGVNIDKARGHQQTLGIDFFAGGAADRADGSDAAVFDGDVGDARLAAQAVMDGAAADDQIEVGHECLPLLWVLWVLCWSTACCADACQFKPWQAAKVDSRPDPMTSFVP